MFTYILGPYKVNGVPLRRVPQSYVIATQTKLDISGVDGDKIDDDMFKRQKKSKGASDNMFEESSEVSYLPLWWKSFGGGGGCIFSGIHNAWYF